MATPVSSPAAPVQFGPDGLVPVVVQDAETNAVLMQAYMNAEALAATRATGLAHYWSRSRGTLWRKGDTSGHVQHVEAIYVNCEQNSLLLRVRQVGAVCHDGYASCYYRRLDADDRLTAVDTPRFDPEAVYGHAASAKPDAAAIPAALDGASDEDAEVDAPAVTGGDADPAKGAGAATASDGKGTSHAQTERALTRASRLLYGAYEYLRDHDLGTVSATSGRLRNAGDDGAGRGGAPDLAERVGDELDELAGVLDGSHAHAGDAGDLILEGCQVLYWVVLVAVRGGIPWARLRPDTALATGTEEMPPLGVARLLRAEAARWRRGRLDEQDVAARCHATLALVGQACAATGLAPLRIVQSDLAALRERPYLRDYFAATGAVA